MTSHSDVVGGTSGWIQTYTGRRYYPLDPRPDDVCIEDIAHALAMKCRYSGHCSSFYSVAEHSVHVARLLPKELQLYGLLHDAAEAYLPDISRPIKHRFVTHDGLGEIEDTFKELEFHNTFAILHALKLDFTPLKDPRIKQADEVMLATECRDLMGQCDQWHNLPDPLPQRIIGMQWFLAEDLFLSTYRHLTGSVS